MPTVSIIKLGDCIILKTNDETEVADKIFPTLTLEGSRYMAGGVAGGGGTSLQLITLKEGDKTVTLPSLSMEQNYPQMLSELVMHM